MVNRKGNSSTQKENEQKKPKGFFRRFPILANIFIMAVLSVVFIFVALFLFDRYTRHNKSVVLPNVVGLPLESAVDLLEANHLSYEVVDSLYTLDKTPGTVLDVVPHEGSAVKPLRTVYLTVVAFGKPQQVIPEVSNMSMRQARATLEGLGFTQISVRYVPGEFDNLTQSLSTSSGRPLVAGERVALDTPITLVVSSNNIDMPDSLVVGDEWTQFLGDSLRVDSLSNTEKVEKKEETTEVMEENERWW